MRPGDKLASFGVLGAALRRLPGRRWCLLVAGDGETRAVVEALFAALPGGRVRFLGQCAPERLATLWAAADISVWPAVREAYGMALLEAQVNGLPVVAGRSGGVPGIVRDGETGLLTPEGDDEAFATAVARLLDDSPLRARMAAAASQGARARHGLAAAAGLLRETLMPLVSRTGEGECDD